jgi:hypothetical protein
MKLEFARFAQRSVLQLQANAPQILFVAGLAGTVTTVVLSSRATLKAAPIMEKLREEREDLEKFRADDAVTDKDYQTVVAVQYKTATKDLVKLYAPSVIIGVASVAALTKSHTILVNRNNALTITVAGLHKMITDYRARVVAELGSQKDLEFVHGTVDREMEVSDKNGKAKVKTVKVLDPDGATPYSLFFDAKYHDWEKSPGYNINFLQNQQAYANRQLITKGHVFLNDVFDLLKIPRTEAGQTVGWLYKTEEGRDNVVDFGFNQHPDFLNGYETDVWLDFNVDGPIAHLIESHNL